MIVTIELSARPTRISQMLYRGGNMSEDGVSSILRRAVLEHTLPTVPNGR